MRIKKQRKQEIEQELVEIATKLMEISKEMHRSIHIDTTYNPEPEYKENEKVTIALYLHGYNEKGTKRTFKSVRGNVGQGAEVIKGILSQTPEYY